MGEREPFDASDPMDAMMDAMSEMFRREVTEVALRAYGVTLYREMDTGQQFRCFLADALTGLVGVCLASGKSEGADAIMECLAECLPYAREKAEEIRDGNGNILKNHHDGDVGQPGSRGE